MPGFRIFKPWLVAVDGNSLGIGFFLLYWYFNIHPYLTFDQLFTEFMITASYLLIVMPTGTLLHVWYAAPLWKYLKNIQTPEKLSPQEIQLARDRTLNQPLVAAVLSWIGWFIPIFIYPTIMHRLYPTLKHEIVYQAAFASFVAGSITAATIFFKMENMMRKWIIPLVFPDGDLSAIHCNYKIHVRGRFIILWFAASFLPILILAVTPLMKLLLDLPQYEAVFQKTLFPLILLIALSSLIAGVILSVLVSLTVSRPIRELTNAMEKVHEGNFDARVQVLSNDELGQLASGFNEMAQGLKEKDFIKDTFGRYVSRQVMDEILDGNLELGGERRMVTILFSDIRDFTRISENLPPEEVIVMLNEYLTAMVDEILSHGGVPDKFLGDGIMAVYGAPLAYGDDAERAVRTALAMRTQLQEINEKRAADGKEAFRIGIGIHSGEVVVGNIGHIEKMEYTAIGDTVNVTSRIESLTKEIKCDILVSESTYEYLPEIFDVNRHGPFELKGRGKLITVYEVLKEKDLPVREEPVVTDEKEAAPLMQTVLSPGFAAS